MSALDDVIQFAKRHGTDVIPLPVALEAAAELVELRARNKELEEYHGFHLGIIPEGEPTVKEIELCAELTHIAEINNQFAIENANLHVQVGDLEQYCDKLRASLAAKTDEVDEMRQALIYYADKGNNGDTDIAVAILDKYPKETPK